MLAEALDALMSCRIITAMDTIGQRFRAIEPLILEGGGSVARHLEVVPKTRVSSVTPGLQAMMAAAERQSHRLKQDVWRLWSGYANQGRSPDEASRHGNADDPAQCSRSCRSKG